MALDSKLTQTITIRANGDKLLEPMEAYGRSINKAIGQLNKLSETMTSGSHKSADEMRKQVQLLQRLIGEASTLQNLMNAGNRKKNGLLFGLDEQSFGKKVASASRLRLELDKTKNSSDALELRLAGLYKKFNDLGEAGKKIGSRDLSKAMRFEEAIRQARTLEREIARIDARAQASGGFSKDGQKLRAALQAKQDGMLNAVQSGKRYDFSKDLAQIQMLTESLRKLSIEENRAADSAVRFAIKTRESLLKTANLDQSQLYAQLQRNASNFRYTPTQARGFNPAVLDKRVEDGMRRMTAAQQVLDRALSSGKSNQALDRLTRSWQGMAKATSEAIAQRRAYDSLPEVKSSNYLKGLFGVGEGGGLMATGKRLAGFALAGQAIYATINALQGGARFIAEFEDALKQLQAIAGATDTEMKGMAASILDVSKNTKFSAIEITQAATQIAQAGFSVQETGAVLKDAMNLATASGATPAEAVDTLTGALGAFQLQADQSTHVTDVLVNGLNRSKLTISQMQAALQYAGATAKETGVSFEELVAVSASLANAGIRSGSTIGTGTRQLLVDLQTPTEKFKKELKDLGLTMADVDVRTNGFMGVIKKLTDSGFSAAAAYESFETRAASAFLALRNQTDTYDELAQSILQTGAAAQANERAMDSLSAKWQQMLNVLGSLTTSIAGPFVTALKGILTVANGVFSFLDGMLKGLGDLIPAFGGVSDAFTSAFVVGIAGFFVGGPWGAVIGALAGLIGGLQDTSGEMDALQAATNDASAKMESQKGHVESLDEAILGLIDRSGVLKTNQAALQTETQTLIGKFEGLSSQLSGTAQSYDELLNAMLRYRGEALQQAKLTAIDTKMAAQDEANGYVPLINANALKAQGRYAVPFREKYVSQYNQSQNTDYTLKGQNQVHAAIIQLRAEAARLEKAGESNSAVKDLIGILEERLNLLQQYFAAKQKVANAEKQIGMANERQSAEGQGRYQAVTEIHGGVSQGLEANERSPGSGGQTINQTLARARAKLTELQNQLKGLQPDSAAAIDIMQTIRLIEAEIARVTRAQRIDAEGDKPTRSPRDRPGQRLSAQQVANRIKELVPQAHINQTTRSAGEQAGYDRAAGIQRDPNSAPHVAGRALDMRPIPGMNPMEIVGMLEDMGLRVTGGPVHASGIRYITPNHGTAPHWHFEWASAFTNAERRTNQDAEKAARDLQKLLEQQADSGASAAGARIKGLTIQAKGGQRPVSELSGEMQQALVDYRNSKLNAFDVAHPLEGLSETEKQYVANARKALEEQVTEEAKNFWSEFQRQIADHATEVFQAAMEASERQWQIAQYDNAAGVRRADSDITASQNRTNRNNGGPGTDYIYARRKENAEQNTDQLNLASLTDKVTRDSAAFDALKKSRDGLVEGSDAYIAKTKEIEAAQRALNETMQQQADLQQKVNDSQRELTAIPLKERLEGAAQAWMQNSGAMDSWQTMVEKGVGPALDTLTSGLTDFFVSIMDGSKSFKQALGDMLKSFATFVLQYIAKCLALMAVKALMTALGIPTPSGAFEGGPVEGGGKFNGGPVGQRYNGGTVNKLWGGGNVKTGVSNQDSSLYELAHGEYVVRNKSVRDLGIPFMETINKHGRKGLDKMGMGMSAFTNVQAPKQETNVYVVQEKQKPSMGPHDVLVTIQEDILAGGSTKKLIKQVAQGG